MTGSSAAIAAVARRDDCDDHDDLDDRDRCGGFWHPPFLSLAVILATIATAIYILLKDDDDELDFNPIPVSPA